MDWTVDRNAALVFAPHYLPNQEGGRVRSLDFTYPLKLFLACRLFE